MEQHLVTVAAIDDDKSSLDLIKAALKQQPVEVFVDTDPEAGLKMVLDRRPQIVLLDLMMPMMNGLEVLDRIVEAAPETEVILMTPFRGEAACHCVVQRCYVPVEIIPAKPNTIPGSA